MRVLLLQLDGSLPNIAVMRIAAHHRGAGDDVAFARATDLKAARYHLARGTPPDRVYASLIFEKTRPLATALQEFRPDAVFGGTGWDVRLQLDDVGITTREHDYSIYPEFLRSIDFVSRGCRMSCSFCVVPAKEGRPRQEKTIAEIWRGEGYPKELLLLDNDPFGYSTWRERFEEIRAEGFRVSFSQGINARFLTEETAAAIASVEFRDDGFTRKRLYTAWDNRRDERTLFRGLELLVKYGVVPDSIMVYMLVGYDHATRSARPALTEDDFYRLERLRKFGARPYPMPYVRTPELVGFQRWIVKGFWKKIPWARWERAGYEPRRLPR